MISSGQFWDNFSTGLGKAWDFVQDKFHFRFCLEQVHDKLGIGLEEVGPGSEQVQSKFQKSLGKFDTSSGFCLGQIWDMFRVLFGTGFGKFGQVQDRFGIGSEEDWGFVQGKFRTSLGFGVS